MLQIHRALYHSAPTGSKSNHVQTYNMLMYNVTCNIQCIMLYFVTKLTTSQQGLKWILSQFHQKKILTIFFHLINPSEYKLGTWFWESESQWINEKILLIAKLSSGYKNNLYQVISCQASHCHCQTWESLGCPSQSSTCNLGSSPVTRCQEISLYNISSNIPG